MPASNPRCVCRHAYDGHQHLTRASDLRCAVCGCGQFRRLWLRPWRWRRRGVSRRFRRDARRFMADNDELLRRLDDLWA